eukprot:CAMPEP_0174853640 /NCGR_PEP_ID=MMETSP1114-20130205/29245_1 /TAXON_ID=312471 /ORGANISM="Neobodo designis, Strain CCAP 1951/1" /LENGTH=435 /DNA_ID=CAMNT_0016088297 /DNA_START=65 /DNA_END=1368 /DNA_ORIENTATION=+
MADAQQNTAPDDVEPVSSPVAEPQAASGAAAADEQPAEPTENSNQEGAAAAAAASDDDEVTERYWIEEDVYNQLLATGFTENAIKKSFAFGCVDAKTSQQWIEMQLDDPELNTPLPPHIRVKIREKKVLTAEEREAKVAELKQRIVDKKERDAAEAKRREAEDAKKRMVDGKAALEAKAEREALQRKLDYEQRRKEKEQDRLAKEKLQKELAVDKLKRGGMDEAAAREQVERDFEQKRKELEEEKKRRLEAQRKAREEEEAARKAAGADAGGKVDAGGGGGGGWDLARLVQPSESEMAEAAGAGAPAAGGPSPSVVVDFDRDEAVVPWPSEGTFTAILARSATTVPATDARSVASRTVLRKVLNAIAENPLDRKLRTLKITSATFTNKIYPMPLACLYLRQAGFQEAASLPELEAAGAHDQLTMHVASLPKVRAA